jgi:hypothetical protein
VFATPHWFAIVTPTDCFVAKNVPENAKWPDEEHALYSRMAFPDCQTISVDLFQSSCLLNENGDGLLTDNHNSNVLWVNRNGSFELNNYQKCSGFPIFPDLSAFTFTDRPFVLLDVDRVPNVRLTRPHSFSLRSSKHKNILHMKRTESGDILWLELVKRKHGKESANGIQLWCCTPDGIKNANLVAQFTVETTIQTAHFLGKDMIAVQCRDNVHLYSPQHVCFRTIPLQKFSNHIVFHPLVPWLLWIAYLGEVENVDNEFSCPVWIEMWDLQSGASQRLVHKQRCPDPMTIADVYVNPLENCISIFVESSNGNVSALYAFTFRAASGPRK